MKAKPITLLLHPAFLCSLGLLLLNDLYLKYTFHNWLTGKLSDFAGLFALAVFLFAFFYRCKKIVMLLTALFFLWWKSQLSEPFIFFLNNQLSLPVSRIVDYSDYLALCIIPFAGLVRPIDLAPSFVRSLAIYSIGILSFISFCATSMPRYLMTDTVHMNKNLRTYLMEEEILQKFEDKGIPIAKDTAYYTRVNSRDKYLKITDSSGQQKTIRINDYPGIELYERSVPYQPTYTIPYLLVNDDTIKNIKIAITGMYNGKKRIVDLQSFSYDSVLRSKYYLTPGGMRHRFQKPIKVIVEDVLR